jgi:hypothetical protein
MDPIPSDPNSIRSDQTALQFPAGKAKDSTIQKACRNSSSLCNRQAETGKPQLFPIFRVPSDTPGKLPEFRHRHKSRTYNVLPNPVSTATDLADS